MYQIFFASHFIQQLKIYKKKHRSIKSDVIFILNHFNREQAVSLGNNIYKIRLKTKSIPKGKSKSFRLIIAVIEIDKIIVPIAIYFKGDFDNMSKNEINNHLNTTLFELRFKKLFS